MRVDALRSQTGDPTQVFVEGRLDAGLPDHVSRPDRAAGIALDLLLRGRADVAESLSRKPTLWIVANVARRDLDAGELIGALEDVVALPAVDVPFGDDRVERIVLPLVDLAIEPARPDAENVGQLLEHRVARRSVTFPGQLRVPNTHLVGEPVLNQDVALGVDDRAARSLKANRPDLVVLGDAQVVVARDDLKRPEADDQGHEQGDRDRAEDSRAQNRLLVDVPGLARTRIARYERAERVLRQAPSPPGRPARRRACRLPGGRGRRRVRSGSG